MKKRAFKKGFTLTEILVVTLIISVLAAVVYPLYTKAVTKSRAVEAINLLEMVRNKQIQKYARSGEYFGEFTSMGQLTNIPGAERPLGEGAQLQIKDYTLSLNNSTNCMSAHYQKGSSDFTFSSSYETAGLGCSGSICTSFGDIIGDAASVCNCGKKSCSNGFTLNDATCNCDCLLPCNKGNSCEAMSTGGLTRPCSTGCGTQTSIASCNGDLWSGKCWSVEQKKSTSERCGFQNTGTRTRECFATCEGGACNPWGQCVGQKCDDIAMPLSSAACGNCGTQTQTVHCDSNSGTWIAGGYGTCTGEGLCVPGATQKCGNNNSGTQICTSSCGWGACTGEEFDCLGTAMQPCGICGIETRSCDRSTGKWIGGTCIEGGKPEGTQSCGNCNKGTQTRDLSCETSSGTWRIGEWSICVGAGECTAGETMPCINSGTQECSESCSWGSCEGQVLECPGLSTQSCGNCNFGKQGRACDTSTGTWSSWLACDGGGECKSGEVKSCGGGNGNQVCNSGCQWGSCVCNPGYTLQGSNCNKAECIGASAESCGGNCGTRRRSCSNGIWGEWGACGETPPDTSCSPGATENGYCPDGRTIRHRTCGFGCTWGAWDNNCSGGSSGGNTGGGGGSSGDKDDGPKCDMMWTEDCVNHGGDFLFCSMKPDGFYPEPNYDWKFYLCANGGSYLMYCVEGLVFDVSCQCCNWPRESLF